MKVSLLCIGKTNSSDLQNLIQEYQKRLPLFIGFELIEIPDIKNTKNLSPIEIQKKEMENLDKWIQSSDRVILLDEKGKEMTSRKFAQQIQSFQNQSVQKLIFIIGGAYGFHPDFRKKYSQKLALSQMTFTHQMIRLFFVEQLYRAYSIIEGKPYHND